MERLTWPSAQDRHVPRQFRRSACLSPLAEQTARALGLEQYARRERSSMQGSSDVFLEAHRFFYLIDGHIEPLRHFIVVALRLMSFPQGFGWNARVFERWAAKCNLRMH